MGVDALVVRHDASGAVARIAGWVDCHVVNAGDGTHEHPTQALLDAYTLRRRLGAPGADLEGGTWRSSATSRTAGWPARTCCCCARSGARVTDRRAADADARRVRLSWPCDTSWDLDAVLSGKAFGDVDAVMMLRVQRERMSGGYFPDRARVRRSATACRPPPRPARRSTCPCCTPAR